MSAKNTIPDSVGKAIAFLALGIVAGLTLDICAKWLLETYSLEQFVFLRSVFGVSFLLLTVSQFGGFASLRTQKWQWHLLRTLLASGAMFGFFYALSKIPLVNALTLAFTAPLMVTALSQPLLGERVGWRRWAAVIVGFAGVLIVLRPAQCNGFQFNRVVEHHFVGGYHTIPGCVASGISTSGFTLHGSKFFTIHHVNGSGHVRNSVVPIVGNLSPSN